MKSRPPGSRLISREVCFIGPVYSLNSLEYEISEDESWLHFYGLPHTDHLGFVFVELRKLLQAVTDEPRLKNARIGGTFLEMPDRTLGSERLEVVNVLTATKSRMEEFMALTPEIVYEIQKEMWEHHLASMRVEARREGKAEEIARLRQTS